jgi:transcriptional regulator GlxA family with amidase domain
MSPRQYLIDWRMSRASKLLAGTDLSVAEVAAATGYASEPAFARTFKRAAGVPPGRFRRERQS